MTPPRVSVIVASYNVADHVNAALKSVLAQTEENLEIIVVDDGSTDGSRKIASRTTKGDPRVRLIKQSNKGLGAARNTGLAAARGDWVAFLDGDDALAPTFVEDLVGAAEDAGVDWAAAGAAFVTDTSHHYRGPLSGDGREGDPSGKRKVVDLSDWAPATTLLTATWNKVYRRKLLNGLRFEEDTWFEDYNFFISVMDRTDKILCLDQPLYRHTRHRDGQITGSDSNRVFDQFSVLERMESLLATSGKDKAQASFNRLASRILIERLYPLRDKVRRQTFLQAIRDFFAEAPRQYDPKAAPMCRFYAPVLEGETLLSVVIPWNGAQDPLNASLDSLEDQSFRAAEILIVADKDGLSPTSDVLDLRVLRQTGRGPGAARNHGLSAAKGRYVLFLDAGDQVEPWGLQHALIAMARTNADMAVTAQSLGERGAWHAGLHGRSAAPEPGQAFSPTGEQILDIQMHPSAKIYKRSLLEASGAQFGKGALSEWPMVLAAALAAERMVYIKEPVIFVDEDPECRQIWTTPARHAEIRATLRALRRLGQNDSRLPQGWLGVFASRAIWESLAWSRFRLPLSRVLYGVLAWVRFRSTLRRSAPSDPYIRRPFQT